MDIDENVEDGSRRVQVRFITKLKLPFKAPTTSIALPSNLTRMGLSAVVNNMLQSVSVSCNLHFCLRNDDWKPEPFDFLIDDFLLARGISAETTIEIEYIKAVAPRKEEDPSLHDDWVNADMERRKSLYTCFRGSQWCNYIGSCCKTKRYDIFLPNSSVQSLASQPNGNMICSGSWDRRINLWETECNKGDFVSIKKRKKGSKEEESQSDYFRLFQVFCTIFYVG
ncbi:hypothetical protein LXL04_025941 [Taraxacum kok-saghyz]